MLTTLITELQSIADTNCPDNTGVYIIDLDDQTTWGFNAKDTATQEQIDAANSAIQNPAVWDSLDYSYDSQTKKWSVKPAAEEKIAAQKLLESTDVKIVRVIEDLIEALDAKNILKKSELPQAAQDKLTARAAARAKL